MTIDIKDKQGQLRVSVPIQNGAKGSFSLMNADYIQLPFSSGTVIPFKLGDYADLSDIEYEGLGGKIAKVYEVVDMNNVNPTYNESTGAYDYNVRLDAYYWKWKNKIFKYTPENGGQEASWSLTAALDVHLGVFLRNLKALGYTYKGTDFIFSIDSTVENKAVTATYNNTNLLDALFMLASKEYYNCDCWVTDNVIHFGRNEFGDAVKIERGVEAESIGKAESKGTYATRIYAFGGTRNIPTNYRPTDEQTVVNGVVQKRLMLPKGTPYIDAYANMTTEEAIEDVVVFDDVYPKRVGTLSDVTTVDRNIVDGDSVVGTFKAYQYKDTGLNFDKKYIIEGQELKIRFQSGKLNGLEFSVQFNPNGEDPAEQLWEIIRNEEYGRPLPDDIMNPEDGDTYVLSGFDIQLVSDQYIPEAEQELLERAQAYADMAKKDDGTYPVTLFSDFVYSDQLRHNYEFGQKVNLVDKAYFPEGRVSRILGWEIKLDIPFDSPQYTCGESMPYSRIGELEEKVEALTYKGQTYTGGGGSGVYIIRTNDSTAPSDSNVFSSLRSIASFLRRDKEDSTNFLIKFLGGLMSDNIESSDFASGPFGTGYLIKKDPKTGKSYIEADEIYIRLKAYFDSLEIKHLSHVGGSIVLSPASMECNRVEVRSGEYETLFDSTGSQLFDSQNDPLNAVLQGGEKVYRCYFNNSDGEKEIVNEFAIDDLAQCREFNVKEGTSQEVSNQYYWRRVVGLGDNYIDLSIDDCDGGSMIPKAGDTIVTIGNKTDVNRQKVVYISSYGEDAPSFKLYSGINSYSMLNKEVTVISPNEEKNVFTGKVVIKPGSAGFSNLTDAPNMTQINSDIKQAQQDASSAKEAVQDAKLDVVDLKSYVDGAFSDGIITEIEAKSIEKYINIVENTSQSARQSYEELYNNSHLVGSAKVALSNAYSILESTINSLINSIETAIADGKTTVGEKQSVDNNYEDFNSAYSDFVRAVESANKSIQDKLKSYSDNAEIAAANAINDAAKAALDAMDAKKAVVNLNDYVDGAFSDGIISSSEAKAIEKYINIVVQTKKECDATYSVLYNNTFLIGVDKILLKLAKDAFDEATSNLILSIQSAISDGKSSSEEASDVNSKYSTFNEKYSDLASAIEDANKSIQSKIKEDAIEESRVKAIEEANKVSQADKDLMAKNMGYKDYEDLENTAKRGETIIQGGMVNTKLINAESIVTSRLIANAIKTNSLNVNDKFIIKNDGSVFTEGKHVSKGILTELSMDNGYLTINYMGEECFRLSVGSDGVPTIVMAHEGNVATISPYLLMFRDKSLKTLRIDPSKLGDGIINKKSDGTLFLDSYSNDNYINIHCSAGVGGKTYPYNGDYVVQEGSMDTVEAVPDAGYVFDSWSDGGAQSHNVVWVAGLRLTASFRPLVGKFTVSLVVEPANSGSTYGGGTEYEGTIKQISATANTGYRFIKWSDGGAQSHNVTWDSNKIITAFFEAYSYSDAELFPGSIFNNSSWESVVGTFSVQSSYINFNISSDGSFMAKYGKGLFDRVLVQGVTYKFRVKLRGTEGETIMLVVASDDLLTDAKIITSVTLSTSSIATVPFESAVSSGDSSFSDQLYIIGSKNLTVYNISLKEWTLE